jgi:hypothetical protein
VKVKGNFSYNQTITFEYGFKKKKKKKGKERRKKASPAPKKTRGPSRYATLTLYLDLGLVGNNYNCHVLSFHWLSRSFPRAHIYLLEK